MLELGADVRRLPPHRLICTGGTSDSAREVLEVLVACRYDIDSESFGLPFLRHVGVGDYGFLKSCLNQGANVNTPNKAPPGHASPREPIVEIDAIVRKIESFELLRSKGAPFDRKFGVFPKAVMVANDGPGQRQMRMLKNPLDFVGCNVNSRSNGPYEFGAMKLSKCSTPLCWIACHTVGEAKELIWTSSVLMKAIGVLQAHAK